MLLPLTSPEPLSKNKLSARVLFPLIPTSTDSVPWLILFTEIKFWIPSWPTRSPLSFVSLILLENWIHCVYCLLRLFGFSTARRRFTESQMYPGWWGCVFFSSWQCAGWFVWFDRSINSLDFLMGSVSYSVCFRCIYCYHCLYDVMHRWVSENVSGSYKCACH